LANKSILVLGAGGMLGHMMIRVLSSNHDVFGTSRAQTSPDNPIAKVLSDEKWIDQVDVNDQSRISLAIARSKPDFVISCVGIVKQGIESQLLANVMYVNSELPHLLNAMCSQSGARLIHFSTDCVFDCSEGSKKSSYKPNATDVYGRSKALGEINDDSAITLRTSIIGRQLYDHKSLVDWAIGNRGRSIKGFTNAIYSGLTTLELSRVVGKIINTKDPITGLWQVASSPISKFDLLSRLNMALGLDLAIEPWDDFVCDRSLDGKEFEMRTGIEIPSWDRMISDFVDDNDFYKDIVIGAAS